MEIDFTDTMVDMRAMSSHPLFDILSWKKTEVMSDVATISKLVTREVREVEHQKNMRHYVEYDHCSRVRHVGCRKLLSLHLQGAAVVLSIDQLPDIENTP